jgi:HAMP domain-containing protein
MGGVKRNPLDADAIKEAADKWFAAFLLIRASHPLSDVETLVAATDYALRTK